MTSTPSTKWRTWWYAIRPHTLGASIAPMLVVTAALIYEGTLSIWPLVLCYVVALSAQIASNLSNDLFDFLDGIDTEERVGFERILTSGKVTMRSMSIALIIALSICLLAGVGLIFASGWWVVLLGIPILLGVFAYSAGPYPLSYHGLGDLAVVLFFGLVPILGSYVAITGQAPHPYLIFLALATGLWQDNILVVNNYRDYHEDSTTGKHTLIVLMGYKSGPKLYLLNSVLALLCTVGALLSQSMYIGAICLGLLCLISYGAGVLSIRKLQGKQLNGLLIYTARISIVVSIGILVALVAKSCIG